MPLYFNNAPYFSLSNTSATNNVPAATMCMWIYPLSSASDVYLDFSKGDGTSSRFEFLWSGSLWQVSGRALDSDNYSTVQTSAMSNYLNYWHFVTACIDFSGAYAYIDVYDLPNGITTASGSMTNMTAGNTSATDSVQAYIGAQDGNATDAYLDDICFYNRLLSSGELQTMYDNKGKTVSEYGLVHRWRMREKNPTSTASTLVDCGSIRTATTINNGSLTYVEGILT